MTFVAQVSYYDDLAADKGVVCFAGLPSLNHCNSRVGLYPLPHPTQVLVRGSIMDSRMTKVECDVLMHLLHRQYVACPSPALLRFPLHFFPSRRAAHCAAAGTA